MKRIALLLVVFMATFLSGCASTPAQWFQPDNPVAEITVRAGTLEYIDGEEAKARGLRDFATDAKDYLMGNPEARAAGAVTVLKGFVPWEKLDESETLIAISVFAVLQARIERQIEEGGLDADSRIYIQNLLDWIIRTCDVYIQDPVTVPENEDAAEEEAMLNEGHRDEGHRAGKLLASLSSGIGGGSSGDKASIEAAAV